MKTNIYFASIFILLSIELPAQSFQWVNSGGGGGTDESYSAALDGAGNVFITGLFSLTATIGGSPYISSGGTNIFIAKYASSGNNIWVRTAGGSGNSGGHVLTVDGTDNVYVAGEFEDTITVGTTTLISEGSSDIFITKYDNAGTFQWAVNAGGSGKDVASSIKTTGGYLYVTGHFEDTTHFGTQQLISAGGKDLFAAKFDTSGNIIWLAGAGGLSDDESRGIASGINGASFIAGHFDSTATFGSATLNNNTGDKDVFIALLDSSGTFQWAKSAGSNGTDDAYDISADNSGNCYVAGFFHDTIAFDSFTLVSNGNDDVFVTKYNSAGVAQWVKKAGGANGDRAYGISSDTLGNVVVTGSFEDTLVFASTTLISNGDKDVFVLRYDSSGNELSALQAGGPGFDRGYGIVSNASGNAYITGTFDQNASFGTFTAINSGMNDLFLARINFVTGVAEDKGEEKPFTVYPNPATKNIYINAAHSVQLPQQLYICNSLGENIFTFSISKSNETINLSFLPTGLYLVRSNNHIEKIIKL